MRKAAFKKIQVYLSKINQVRICSFNKSSGYHTLKDISTMKRNNSDTRWKWNREELYGR